MREYSDIELIELLAAPDDRKNDLALKAIYANCYSLIKQYIFKNSGSNEEAADIFQDSVIVLFNKVREPKFKLNAALSTFLFAISRNLWLKRLRKKNREVQLDDSLLQFKDQSDSQIELLIKDEKSELVADLFEQMSPDCKQILLYFYYEKLSMKEIMQRMNISSMAVAKNKKMNCLKALRKKIIASPHYSKLLK